MHGRDARPVLEVVETVLMVLGVCLSVFALAYALCEVVHEAATCLEVLHSVVHNVPLS
jgi:hypothetical protein